MRRILPLPALRRLASRVRASSTPRVVRLLLLVTWLLFAAYALHALGLLGGPTYDSVFVKWVNDLIVVLGAAVCLWRAIAVGRDRPVWLLLSVGLVAWVAGNVYYSIFLVDVDPLPVPSVADGFWLGIYPPSFVALGLLLVSQVRSFRASLWLDSVIVALGAAALSASIVIGQVLDAASEQDLAATLTNVAYPVGDLVLLVLVLAAFALGDWRFDRMWACLGGGLVAFMVTDSLFLVQTANGSYQVGTIVDAGWLLAAVLVAEAAWQPRRRARAVRFDGWRLYSVPVLFGSASLTLLVWDHFERVHPVGVWLSAGAISAVIVRLAVTLREQSKALRAASRARDRASAAERALRRSEAQYRLLFEQNPNPMWVFDKETRAFLAVNDAAVAEYGYSRAEFMEMTIFDIRPGEEREALAADLAGSRSRDVWSHRRKDGSLLQAQVTANDIPFAGRDARVALALNVTAQLDAESALRESEQRYHDLFENAGEPIATVDLDGVLTEVNHAFEQVIGYDRAELLGTQVNDYVTEQDREVALVARARKLSGEIEVTTYEQDFVAKDGSLVTLEVSTRVIEERGTPIGVQGMCRDVTARRHAEAELRRLVELNRHQALHDALTGLPNRRCFGERIEQEIEATRAGDGAFAVLVLDLDRFKEINDTLGYQQGDRLLSELADRLRVALPAGTFIAHLGGDEFGILLSASADPRADSEAAVARIDRALERPFNLRGLPIGVEASVGVAMYPLDGAVADALVQHADVAMYVAKEESQSHVYFAPHQVRLDTDRLTLIGELRRALDQRELAVHYQPQIDVQTGEISGAEALVRWRHPTRGLVSPGEFVPLAEQTGLVNPLTFFVLDEALRQQKLWRRAGRRLTMAVNISARSLLDAGFAGGVAALLAEHGADPQGLVLEVTESAIIRDPARAQAVLEALSREGIRIALDDFGTGYSSLTHLSRLPLDQIKIDRSFVCNAAKEPNDAAIVRSIVHLARDVELEVVAEGVENEVVWSVIEEYGCDLAQGFLLSKPLPADGFTQVLERGLSGTRGVAA